MRGLVLVLRVSALAVVLAVAANSASRANPLPDPPRLFTIDGLRATLASSGALQRDPATKQLAALGHSHMDLIAESLHSEYTDVQLASVKALWRIGTEESLGLLRNTLADSSATHSDRVRIAAAEALADRHDLSALPLMKALVAECHDDRLHEGLTRALSLLKRTLLDQPTMSMIGDHVLLHFLLEDVEDISVSARRADIPYHLPKEDWELFCQSLQMAEKTSGGGMWSPRLTLHLVLVDGRDVVLTTDCLSNRFMYRGNGRLLEHHTLAVASEELREFLKQRIPPEALPERCREIFEGDEQQTN